ncbi:glycosyl transferase family 2 [Beutenbergia cavernae DSM 12333]|uniref:Glycosyl transferase family 2 n=1 Tax=Beutenbergia cavernae (strain ATCC BAA-8 / DSM 12333 / CCUG 43141 / JCM 11478 / NBRC 16432 / NCIMB 13614 / HKI 0122) TaxID=471853 RepID=C5C148_BEUC1|nr:CDP-glycerol glycerophosphotransferase family protein [Beutenbergia cavernae]ACQ79452.1 glycosyl transferase family 2 [Beutenbergia cavernae DSM 12333]
MSGAAAPRFSLVTAVHDVAPYLDAFIESIEAQTFPHAAFEVIAVDDGSRDGSLDRLRAWAAESTMTVTVLSQTNAGQGAARNRGLAQARGAWVTFPDPDDWLGDDYLARVDGFLTEHPETSMVATNRLSYLDGVDSEPRAGHPLRAFFAEGDVLVDLAARTDRFHGSAPAAFFDRERLLAHDVLFDPRIRPNFEDGHFCVQYLLTFPAPTIGFVSSAQYVYRRRADGSSTLQNKRLDPRHFTDVPRYGYLDALERAHQAQGRAPVWLQQFVLYELSWYFEEDKAMSNSPTAGTGEVGAAFVELLGRISEHLENWVVEQFDVRRFDRDWRDILLHGVRDRPWVSPYAVRHEYDRTKRELRISYGYAHTTPQETFLADGRVVEPTAQKVRAVEYFGQQLLAERIAWIPVEEGVAVLLDGQIVDIRDGAPGPLRADVSAARDDHADAASWRQRLRLRTRALNALADHGRYHRRYQDAWTLMDRVHNADDNAERLFRYLRAHEPSVNAWFVLDRGSADWRRLEQDGFGDRLVHYGSVEWILLLMNTRHLVSSHIDRPHQEPQPVVWMRPPTWRYTFLQHGVIQDDLSRWLNWKQIDLFVTSTPAEHASIVDDGSPYRFTTKEVRMTGLPRFDRLRALAQETPPDQRDLVLIAPTWRNWLSDEPAPGTTRRTIRPDFRDSEYVREWSALVSSPALRQLAEASGKQVAFLPHPNIQPVLAELGVADHVRLLTFEGQDVQGYFARAAALVTDYSSMAFNAAYVDRPVVYFQFDYDLAMTGGHLGRQGYFSYQRDGFGPVVRTLEDALTALAELGSNGWDLPATYRERIEQTFPLRDGRCCERAVAAIRDLDAPPVESRPG